MTIRIPVGPSGKVAAWALVDHADYERVIEYRWYLNGRGYAFSPIAKQSIPPIAKRSIFMHSFILGRVGADDGLEVDHVNRDRLDNRRSNLRVTSHEENVDNSSHGDRRRDLRPLAREMREQGMTLAEVSDDLGVGVGAVAVWTEGITVVRRSQLTWTREKVADAIREFAAEHGRLPRQKDMRPEFGMPWFTSVYRRFPGGIREAREYAGFGAVDLRCDSDSAVREAAA